MSESHADGRHASTNSLDRSFWARTCPNCAATFDANTGLPLLAEENT